MSTNITAPNIAFITATDQFFAIWKNTRVMKASGWVYKASSDATNTKNTDGYLISDYWGPGGIVAGNIQLGSQTGSGASVSTVAATQTTLTGLSNMTSASVGHAITISGATNTGNNGTFTIVAFISSSSVRIYNPNPGVVEASTLTWSERISGSASITWSSITNGREQTISGLTGMTVNSPGHHIYLQGSANASNNGVFQILSFVSATSIIIINNNVGAASNTNSGQWTELDSLLDVYPSSFQNNTGSGCWINLQGPSTLKIPISAVSTGIFIKGENITQSVTGAQGELLGYQFDTTTNSGFLVVMPRINGIGSGVKGWSTGSTIITGTSSTATVTTTTSTPIEYIREMVFWKGSATQLQGTWYYQCIDGAGESASRFSTLASTVAAVSATVAPGGGGTGNTFPALGACAVRGTGGAQSSSGWIWLPTSANAGKLQLMAVNADYTTGSSADGTWTLAVGFPGASSVPNGGAFVGLGFYRLDNNEDGDVDPYVLFVPNSGTTSPYNASRTGAQAPSTSDNDNFSCGNNAGAGFTYFCGFRRRGFSSNDGFQQFHAAGLAPVGTGQTNFAYNFTYDNDSVATSLSALPVKVREAIWVISVQTTMGSNQANQFFGKMRKGTIRWGFMVSGGNGCDTYDSRKWVQLSSTNGPWVIGPWDGVSTPTQT